MARYFLTLVDGFVRIPEHPVSELPLLDSAERHQLVQEWNDTAISYGPASCLHELIAEQAERTPEAPALVFEGSSLSHGEVERRANHLAWRLRELGVGPEVRVAVAVDRSLELPLALLAQHWPDVGWLLAVIAYVPVLGFMLWSGAGSPIERGKLNPA